MRERERDVVGIICVIIYDDLALKAWTQRRERERERERERVALEVYIANLSLFTHGDTRGYKLRGGC